MPFLTQNTTTISCVYFLVVLNSHLFRLVGKILFMCSTSLITYQNIFFWSKSSDLQGVKVGHLCIISLFGAQLRKYIRNWESFHHYSSMITQDLICHLEEKPNAFFLFFYEIIQWLKRITYVTFPSTVTRYFEHRVNQTQVAWHHEKIPYW